MSGYYLYPMLWGVLVDENHTEGERELETLLKSKMSAGCISLPTLLALPGACELTVPSTSYTLLFWVPPGYLIGMKVEFTILNHQRELYLGAVICSVTHLITETEGLEPHC